MSDRRRTASQIHRRGIWPGPQSSDLRDRDDDTISNYSNPDYIVGNPTPAALNRQSNLDLDTSREIEGPYELDGSSCIVELPTRTWPDHLSQHGELDEYSDDDNGGLRNSWIYKSPRGVIQNE